MVDIKYVIRMEVIDTRIDCSSSFEVYDTFEEALREYNQQIKYMQEDYVNGPRPDQESIAIMSLYSAKVIKNCHLDSKKYALVDLIHHTIAQYGSVKTFWANRQYEDIDDWEDCK